MASALQGPFWKRALWSQLMIDETTAVGAAQTKLRWRRYGYLCTGAFVFVAWNTSTLVGAAVLSSTGSLVVDWGLDATIPAAFLALLWPRLRDAGQRRTAAAGALLAIALVPYTPAGIPILAAGLGVAAGWRARGSRPGPGHEPGGGDEDPTGRELRGAPA
jgi:branched chain amino acid efflux pump